MRRFVTLGGGGFSMEPENPLLDDFLLGLTGVARPRVCFVPTAGGDSDNYIMRFYQALARKTEASHLALFNRAIRNIDAYLRGHDLIFVGGGNTANMLATWRVHGVVDALAAAADAGVILAGVSAGALCWYEAGVTDSFGPQLDALDALGWLPGCFCPHYDGDPLRRPVTHRMVAEGRLGTVHAADDGAALVWEDRRLVEVVSSRPDARAYRVERAVSGAAVETPLPARYLG
jgi:dipeptidase E